MPLEPIASLVSCLQDEGLRRFIKYIRMTAAGQVGVAVEGVDVRVLLLGVDCTKGCCWEHAMVHTACTFA